MADSPPTSTSGFKLSDAVSVFSQQTQAMNQLWAFYTTTVLGSLAFGFTQNHTPLTAAVFLLAYWAFAIGELALLQQTLKIINGSLQNIRSYVNKNPMKDEGVESFKSTLLLIAGEGRRTNPFWISLAVQIIGNFSVTLLLLFRAFSAAH